MLGTRNYHLTVDSWFKLQCGEYMYDGEQWWARVPPNRSYPKGAIANLEAHDVVEHEDGTITVSPSIAVSGGGYWHGYLTRGVWSEV